MSESLKQRVTTAIIIGLPILFLIIFSDTTRLIFAAALSGLLLWEFLNLIYTFQGNQIKFASAFAVAACLFYLAYTRGDLYNFFIRLSLIINILLIIDLFFSKRKRERSYSWITGVMYTVLPLTLLFLIRDKDYFMIIIISVLLLSWISDISAYFVGKSIGKHKLMPRISPGKTWEGFLGAGMIVLIFSYFFASYSDVFPFQLWIIIGLSVWIFGVAGDLVESKLKRQLDLKDSGTILPGHGGFLDRFDGFYFCLPFVLIIINYYQ